MKLKKSILFIFLCLPYLNFSGTRKRIGQAIGKEVAQHLPQTTRRAAVLRARQAGLGPKRPSSRAAEKLDIQQRAQQEKLREKIKIRQAKLAKEERERKAQLAEKQRIQRLKLQEKKPQPTRAEQKEVSRPEETLQPKKVKLFKPDFAEEQKQQRIKEEQQAREEESRFHERAKQAKKQQELKEKREAEQKERQRKAQKRREEVQRSRAAKRAGLIKQQEKRVTERKRKRKEVEEIEKQLQLVRPVYVIPVEKPVEIQRAEELPPFAEEEIAKIPQPVGIPLPAKPIPAPVDFPEPEDEEEILPSEELTEPKPPLKKSPSQIIRKEEEALFEQLEKFEKERILNPYDIQLIAFLEQYGRVMVEFLQKPNEELITLKMPREWGNNIKLLVNKINAFNHAAELATKPEQIEPLKRSWLDFLGHHAGRLEIAIGL